MVAVLSRLSPPGRSSVGEFNDAPKPASTRPAGMENKGTASAKTLGGEESFKSLDLSPDWIGTGREGRGGCGERMAFTPYVRMVRMDLASPPESPRRKPKITKVVLKRDRETGSEGSGRIIESGRISSESGDEKREEKQRNKKRKGKGVERRMEDKEKDKIIQEQERKIKELEERLSETGEMVL